MHVPFSAELWKLLCSYSNELHDWQRLVASAGAFVLVFTCYGVVEANIKAGGFVGSKDAADIQSKEDSKKH